MRSYRIFLFVFVLLVSTQPLFAANAPWPMFMQNPRHTGQTNINVPSISGNPTIKWTNKFAASIVSSPAISPNGTLYIADYGSQLHAINSINGNTIWTHTLSGPSASSPALDLAGNMIVTTINHDCYSISTNNVLKWSNRAGDVINTSVSIGPDNTVYFGCVDHKVYALTNGKIKWTNRTGGEVNSTPAIGSNGTVYVGSDDEKFYAITNGKVKWTQPTTGYISSSPVIGLDQSIYVGSADHNLYAFAFDGTKNWAYPIGGTVFSSPALAPNGNIYIASYSNNLLWAIGKDGSFKWTAQLNGNAYSSPSVDLSGTIYIGCSDSNFYAFNTNGSLKWKFKTKGSISYSSSSIGNDGTLYIGDNLGYLYAITEGPPPPPTWKSLNGKSTSSNALAWHINGNVTSQTLYRGTTTNSSSAVKITSFADSSTTNYTDNDVVLQPNTKYYYWMKTYFNGKASSFSSMGSARTWATKSPWPMFKGNNRRTGSTNMNVRGVKGNPVIKLNVILTYLMESTPTLGPDGTVYIGDRDINCFYGSCYAYTNCVIKWTQPVYGLIGSPAIGPDGTIYLGSCYGQKNASPSNIWALNPDMSVKWRCYADQQIDTSPAIGQDGTIYIASRASNIIAVTNGKIKWQNHLGSWVMSSPAIGDNGAIYIGCADNYIYAFSPEGKTNWKYKADGGISSSPVISDHGAIYVGSDDSKLYALNMTNGSFLWSFPTGGAIISSPAIDKNGNIFFGSCDNKIYGLKDNGSLLWTNRTGDQIQSTPVLDNNGTLYIGSYDGYIYAITNGVVSWKLNTGGIILKQSIAIANDGTMYIGNNAKHFFAIGEGALQPSIISHAISTNKISLSWRAVSGVSFTTSFTLFCSTNNSLSSITNTSSRIRGFSSTETNYTITNLSKATKYYCILRSYNSLAPSLLAGAVMSNRTFAIKPFAPVLYPPSVLSSSSLGISWQSLDNTTSWSLFRNTSNSTLGLVHFPSFALSQTNYPSDSGLNVNTKYFYFLKAINAMGSSPFSTPVSNTTLAGPALLSFNPDLPYVGTNKSFIVTNKKQVGSGFMKGYLYQWNMTNAAPATYQKQWTNTIFSNACKTNIAASEGAWYLHIISVNSNGLTSYPQTYGPFYYYAQIVNGIRIKTDQDQINNNGSTYATISTVVPISNEAPPHGVITSSNKFFINIIEGHCHIICSGTNNGLPYILSSPSNISFKISGTVINKVRLQVYWEADPSKSDTVTVLISPPMDLNAEHPAVIYQNVLNPDKFDKLNIYIIAGQDERVEVKIYDVMERRLVYETETAAGTMRNVEWDLKMKNGKNIPDKFYGVLVKGQSWKREIKFAVKRGYP